MHHPDLFKKRHSLAHILLMAVKHHFPYAMPTIGPVIDNGFYYDIDFSDGPKPSTDDFEKLEKTMREIIAKHLDFKKEAITKDQAKALFPNNKYKQELIDGIADEEITIY